MVNRWLQTMLIILLLFVSAGCAVPGNKGPEMIEDNYSQLPENVGPVDLLPEKELNPEKGQGPGKLSEEDILVQTQSPVLDPEAEKVLKDLEKELDNVFSVLQRLDDVDEADLTFE